MILDTLSEPALIRYLKYCDLTNLCLRHTHAQETYQKIVQVGLLEETCMKNWMQVVICSSQFLAEIKWQKTLSTLQALQYALAAV